MRSRRVLGVVVAAALLTGSGIAVAGTTDDQAGVLKDERHFREQALKDYSGGNKTGSAVSMVVVGHDDLGARGFNADVWTHDGYAYVGHWGFTDWASGNDRFCPSAAASGVAVLDTRGPAHPQRVATLQNPPGTSAEDVVVYAARYGRFAGRDIAVAGIQSCSGSRYDLTAEHGLMLWDVTTPHSPLQLGYLRTACCTRGVHEFEVQHRADLGRTFAYATVPTSRYPDSETASGVRDQNGDGDFRLIDITDPTAPQQVSDWGIQDAGGPLSAGQGCDADANYGHGAEPTEDGRQVFVSYWDSGFVKLDLTDPTRPLYLGRTVYPANADGDAHSSQYDESRRLLFTADEDFCKTSGAGIEKGYGYMRVYDYAKSAAPAQIGEYRTPKLARIRRSSGRRLRDPQQLPRRHRRLLVLVLGRRARDRHEQSTRAARGRLVRTPGDDQPRQTLPAWNADEHDAGVGRGGRRGDRPHLRQRHELRPLDPPPHELMSATRGGRARLAS